MQQQSNADLVKDLYRDLARKYNTYGPTVEKYWRSFDQEQRIRCIKAGAMDGEVLKDPMDRALGNVYKVIPEWNLRDLTPGCDYFLNLLCHRSRKDPLEQYHRGLDDGPGDLEFIEDMMRTRNLRMTVSHKDCWTFFASMEGYGKSYKFHDSSALADIESCINMRTVIPQETGELILMRQTYLLQILNIIIEDILEAGSTTRGSKPRPKNPGDATAEAFSKLQIRDVPAQFSLPDLIAHANDQKASLEDYLELLSSEPVVLAHDVNHWFFSRPELVIDEKGRSLAQHTDKYISSSVLDAVHSAVKGAAVWAYIDRLLERLEETGTDKVYRSIILQELSNICHFEFSRTQSLLKRHVAKNSKLFKRMSNVYDAAGNARLAMKVEPENYTQSDPQLHYILRLCHPDTNVIRSVEWMRKLGELHQNHPTERERLSEGEVDSLCNLAVVIGFIQDLSPAVSMPALSRKKGQHFVSQSQRLDLELNKLRNDVDLDLRDYAAPIDNLLEPGMAEGALKTLDQLIIKKAGTKLGFLYEDLIEDSLSYLQNQYKEAKAKTEWTPQPMPPFASAPGEELVHQRKEKEKTRPSPCSSYEIAPETKGFLAPEPPAQKIKISVATAAVLTSIFRKSESRGSVSWAAFEGAMADLGFSVLPKFGSVFTFLPPETMEIKKPFTVHRPHKSKIEGHILLFFAQRMRRLYGWDEETFEVA